MGIPNTYHTHTYRCKHASGKVVDYCQAAENAGMKFIGITDHTPLPDNRWLETRMHINELESHLADVSFAKKEVREIHIFNAMECEYAEEFNDFYKEELLGKYNLDYLIGAIHYIPKSGRWQSSFNLKEDDEFMRYAEHLVKAMESKLFSFIAHPDIFAIPHLKWSNALQKATTHILSAAESLGVPLELNTYGFRKPHHHLENNETMATYPREEFWQTAQQYRIKTIVNSDAHRPEDVTVGFDLANVWVEKFQLQTIELSEYLLGIKTKDW